MLKVNNLKKYFESAQGCTKAVDGISFELSQNNILGIVGESGSGKSTLGKLLVGLHDKTEGEVEWNKQSMPQKFQAKDFVQFSQDIQMIFQDPYSALNPRMQIWQILEEPCLLSRDKKYLRLNKEERLNFLQQWLTKVGLRAEYYDRYPHEFSGGQQQRIGIARALIQRPKLLICDEPISALDVSVQAQIVNLIKSLQAELEMSVLFIAHDLAMVNYLCDEVAVMYLGKVVEYGNTQSVFENPQHPYTQLLIASNPLISEGKKTIKSNEVVMDKEVNKNIMTPEGCQFAARCWRYTAQCSVETPILKTKDIKGVMLDSISSSIARKVACINL